MNAPSRLRFSVLAVLLASMARLAGAQDVVVVVHPDVAVEKLSRQDLEDIFLKKLEAWPDGTAVQPVDQPPDSPVREIFTREVHRKPISSIQSFWRRQIFSGQDTPPPMEDNNLVDDFVRSRPGAVGYLVVLADSDLAGLKVVARLSELSDEELAQVAAEPEPPEATLVAIEPSRPEHLYVHFFDLGLYRSTNGGEAWQAAGAGLEGLPIRALAALREPGFVLAGDENGVYRSEDGGIGFARLPEGPKDVYEIQLHPFTHDLYVVTGTGLLRGTPSGGFFVELPSLRNLASVAERSGAFGAPAFSTVGPEVWLGVHREVLYSADGGRWEKLPGEAPLAIRDLAVSLDRDLWIATATGVYRTFHGDEGMTWVPTRLSKDATQVATTPGAVFALSEGVLHRSVDGGRTWDVVEGRESDALTVDSQYPDRLFLTAKGQILRSLDQGGGWRGVFVTDSEPNFQGRPQPKVQPPIPVALRDGEDGDHFAVLVLDPDDTDAVWAAGRQGVWHGTDNGRQWTWAGDGLELTDVHALAPHPRHEGVVYAGTRGAGVWKTENGGKSWQAVNGKPPYGRLGDPNVGGRLIHSLAVDPHEKEKVYAGTDLGLAVSKDGGASWERLEPVAASGNAVPDDDRLPPVTALDFAPGAALSVTAGTSWGNFFSGHGMGLMARRLPGTLEVDRQRLEQGCDLAFNSMPAQLQPWGSSCLAFLGVAAGGLAVRDLAYDAGSTGEEVYAASLAGAWRRLGDDTWTRLNADTGEAGGGLNVAAVAPAEGGLFAGTSTGLWYLPAFRDRRARWRPFQVQEPVFAVAVAPHGRTVYAGLDGRIAVLEDKGDTWQKHVAALQSWLNVQPADPPQNAVVLPSPRDPVPREKASRSTTPREFRRRPPRPVQKVTPETLKAWFRYLATPRDRLRLRSLLAVEMLSRATADHYEILENELRHTLSELRSTDGIQGLDVSPDGRWLATDYRLDDGIRVHSELRLFDTANLAVRENGISPLSLRWNLRHDLAQEGEHLSPSWILPDAGPILAWSPDANHVATHDDLERVRIHALFGAGTTPRIPGSSVYDLPPSTGPITSVTISNGGERLVLATREGTDALIHVLRRRTNFTATPRATPRSQGDGERSWTEIETFRVEGSAAVPAPSFRDVFLLPGERWLLGFDGGGEARAWMLSSPGKKKSERETPEPFAINDDDSAWGGVRLSGNGRWVAAISFKGDLHLWRLGGDGPSSSRVLMTEASRVTFSRDSRWLLARGRGQVQLWDLAKPSVQLTLTEHTDGLAHFARLPASYKIFLVLREDSLARTWDLSVEPLRAAIHHVGALPNLPDGLSVDDGRRHFTARGVDLFVLDLDEAVPRTLAARAGRFGPVGLHADERTMDTWYVHALRELSVDLSQLSVKELAALACRVNGRALTEAEWKLYFPSDGYAPACVPRPETPRSARP